MRAIMSSTPFEWPCAVSTTTTSTPASRSAATRSSVSCAVPTAAPTRSRPDGSLQARGNSVAFWKSFTVIMPRSSCVAVHHQHLLDAVLVQQQQHFVLRRVLAHGDQALLRRHDRRHRRVELHFEAQVAVRDDADDLGALHHRHAGDALRSGELDDLADGHVGRDGDRVADHAALELLDARDFGGLASMVMFLWTMPMPPSCAMVMARRASVTVSMAADTSGRLSRMSRVRCVPRSTSRGQDFRVSRD